MKSGKKLTKDDLDELDELCTDETDTTKEDDAITTANLVQNSVTRGRKRKTTDYDGFEEQSDEESRLSTGERRSRRIANDERIRISTSDDIENKEDRRNSVEVQVQISLVMSSSFSFDVSFANKVKRCKSTITSLCVCYTCV